MGSIGPLPSTSDTNYLIDLIFGTYNELPLFFQLSEITWCLIVFHGSHNPMNNVTSGRHLGFSKFQIFFIFEFNTDTDEKTTFNDWNLQHCKISFKVSYI